LKFAVQTNPKSQQPSEKMMELALRLAKLRDSWVEMSLILADMLIETESPRRDEVLLEVERYLTGLQESDR
jgi:hypothetical protein